MQKRTIQGSEDRSVSAGDSKKDMNKWLRENGPVYWFFGWKEMRGKVNLL